MRIKWKIYPGLPWYKHISAHLDRSAYPMQLYADPKYQKGADCWQILHTQSPSQIGEYAVVCRRNAYAWAHE